MRLFFVASSIGNTQRLAFLDLAKGILVLLMVVYHSLNYTNQYHLAFRYLSFLPPSFILITGLLLSIVYLPRFRAGDRRLWGRLLSRGGKLLLLFIALNVVAQYVRSPVYGQSQSVGVSRLFEHWHSIFVLGDGRLVSFEVLLPIAYLLALAPALLWVAHQSSAALIVLTFLFTAVCTWLNLTSDSFATLDFLSVGLVGVAIGRFLPRPETIGRPLLASAIAFAAYFPLSVYKGYVYLVQLAGATIAVVLICSLCLRMAGMAWWQRHLARLGQYSLLSYIVQIGLLQVLSRLVGRPDPVSWTSLLLLLSTLALMSGFVEFTHWLRRQSTLLDRTYKTVLA